MGGLVSGALAGCGGDTPPAAPAAGGTAPAASGTASADGVAVTSNTEVHLCRGLNACKGLGGGDSKGKNECAGRGECATVEAHSCGGQNECKGLGGCGTTAGANSCKGKGGCHVPLMDSAWKSVRARFEETMKGEKKEFGEAPPAKKS